MATTLTLDGETLTLPTANDTSWDAHLNNTITSIVAKVNETVEAPTRTALVGLSGGWTAGTCEYWVDALGMVHIQGDVTGTMGADMDFYTNPIPAPLMPSSIVPGVAVVAQSGGPRILAGVYFESGSIVLTLPPGETLGDDYLSFYITYPEP